MNLAADPIAYFDRWLAGPIAPVEGGSVRSIVNALNLHPIAEDDTATDYVMPLCRQREVAGRFQVFGENQDLWACFVRAGAEVEQDPPVYFAADLDLVVDYGVDPADVIDGDHLMIAATFTGFLWQMLGGLICNRTERGGALAPMVHGVNFAKPVRLDASWANPSGRETPWGTCFFTDDAICVPRWGAAFLDHAAGRRFVERHAPAIARTWG